MLHCVALPRDASPMNDDQPERDMMVRAAWLSYVAERTQAEIAAILSLSPVTVRRHLSDAQAKLRRAAAAHNAVESIILWNARRAS